MLSCIYTIQILFCLPQVDQMFSFKVDSFQKRDKKFERVACPENVFIPLRSPVLWCTVFTLNIVTLLTILVKKIRAILFNYLLMCLQTAGWVANRVNPDQIPCSAASALRLHWLLSLSVLILRVIIEVQCCVIFSSAVFEENNEVLS